jgi:Putative metal-binding motif/Sulfatase-modifying factor enzyme 1
MSYRRSTSIQVGWLGLLILTPVWAGCQDRLHAFTGMGVVQLDDAGAGDRGQATGGNAGATGGRTGTGGSVVLGTGGSGACVPSGKETCANVGIDNDCDGDLTDVDPSELTDNANCGACFNLCNQANAENIQCLQDTTTGVVGCHFSCLPGFKDLDVDSKNGCECQIENAIELCNLKDDNCNGTIDEGFDLLADPANCGRCGVRCQYPFAQAICNAGTCMKGSCLAGFFDANRMDGDGCECQRTNGGVEICDGVDNNCDGMIDEAASITGRPACKTLGVCAGVVARCNGVNGWACTYSADYQTVEDMAKGCDNKDNDCDGRVDEAFDIGKTCPVGTGPCAGAGTWVCDGAGGRRCNGQMLAPQPETCNGLDDDCDGTIDELNSQANRTVDDRLVYFPARNVTMFAYEATRYDASATSSGFDSTRRPCSVSGKRPWASITKEEAAAACARVGTGWRLCTAADWFDACNGAGNTTFPYGANYVGTTCVGYDYTAPAPNTAPAATGAAPMCISDLSAGAVGDAAIAGDELYDMSGNVKEWVLTTVTPATYEMRGGAYDIASFVDNSVTPAVRQAPGLQCDASSPAPSVAVRLPSVGFRCCLPGQLPAQ